MQPNVQYIPSDYLVFAVAITAVLTFLLAFALGWVLRSWVGKDLWAWLGFLCGAAGAAAGPVEAVQAATADARSLPAAQAHGTRYLWLCHPEDQVDLPPVASFWANSGSTEAEAVRLRRVGKELLAVYLPAYGPGKLEVWERFAEADPYFHEKAVAVGVGQVVTFLEPFAFANGVQAKVGDAFPFVRAEGGQVLFSAGGKQTWVNASRVKVTAANAVASRLVPSMGQGELASLCRSSAPILRADWWAAQVAVQADRKVGYYDWLGVGKKRDDFDKLVGFDKKAAQGRRKEVSAIVTESIVALHNRHIYRFGMIDGAYWITQDAKNNDGTRNAVRLLNGDYKHDAEEIIATLPNGLHAFYLSDAAGARADSAPDFIASDGRSTSPDRRVHAGLSCVRCHVEGIRPIDCWFRKSYAAPDQLDVLDPARAIRIAQLYASDLDRLIARDQLDHEAAVRKATGHGSEDNAKLVAAVYSRYQDEAVTLAKAAQELGCKPDQLLALLRMHKGRLDPALHALGKVVFERNADGVLEEKRDVIPLRREHWEEVYQLAWSLVREAQ